MASCCCCCCHEVGDGKPEEDDEGDGEEEEAFLWPPREGASFAVVVGRTDVGVVFRDLSDPTDADVGIRIGLGLAFPLEEREWACLGMDEFVHKFVQY